MNISEPIPKKTIGNETLRQKNPISRNISLITSIEGFIFSTLFFYALNNQVSPVLPDIKNSLVIDRFINSFHSFFVFCCASAYLKKYISLEVWRKLLSFSVGYFLYDFARELFFEGHMDFASISQVYLHHTLLLVVIINYFKIYNKVIAKGLLAEITNPFLNTSWFLIKSEQQNTMFAKIIGLCLVIVYGSSRIYNFTRFYFSSYWRKRIMFGLICFFPILIMNYYWFGLILKKFVYLLQAKYEKV